MVTTMTPSILDFHELANVVLFAQALPAIPASLVAVIAVLSRVVSTAAQLLCVGVAYLSGDRQVHQVQQEQAAKQSLSSQEQAKEEEKTLPPIEISSDVMVERGAVGE